MQLKKLNVFADSELIGQLHSAAGTFNQLKDLIHCRKEKQHYLSGIPQPALPSHSRIMKVLVCLVVIIKWEWNKQSDDRNLIHSRRRKSTENGKRNQALVKTSGTKNMRVTIRSHAFHMCIKNISLDTLSIYFGSILEKKFYAFVLLQIYARWGLYRCGKLEIRISLKCTSSRRIKMIRKRHRHTCTRHWHVELGKWGRSWGSGAARLQAKQSQGGAHPLRTGGEGNRKTSI